VSTDAAVTAPAETQDESMLEAVSTTSTPTADATLPDDRFLNREVSWLDFNARVLALAQERTAPLLERAKFLAIFASNLDEFFMVRVAGLMRRQDMGLGVRSADGLGTREQLALIAGKARELSQEHARCFLEEVQPALQEEGIRLVLWRDLTPSQQGRCTTTSGPAVPGAHAARRRPGHPFPYISGLSLNLAVLVRTPRRAPSTSRG
jgi:polyphosphate kinase